MTEIPEKRRARGNVENDSVFKSLVGPSELSRILGVTQGYVSQQIAKNGKWERFLDPDTRQIILGKCVSYYVSELREKRQDNLTPVQRAKIALEEEKMYYARQKRMGDRIRLKKNLVMQMFEALTGIVSRFRDRLKNLPQSTQADVLPIFDELLAELASHDRDDIVRNAPDTLPDSDIEAEIAEEFAELDAAEIDEDEE